MLCYLSQTQMINNKPTSDLCTARQRQKQMSLWPQYIKGRFKSMAEIVLQGSSHKLAIFSKLVFLLLYNIVLT